MRCKEVIRRINNSVAPDSEMREHIKSCPACARAFKAASILNNALKSEKEKSIETTPFAEIRSRIIRKTAEKKKESIMSIMKNQINRRSGLVTGLSLAVIVFLFITLVPFSYTTTVGYDLVYANLNEANITPGQLPRALAALGYEDAGIEFDGGNCLISGLPDKQAAREVAIAVKALTGFQADPQIRPITGVVSGSLFAQVREKLHIEVETEGKSDQQIADEIRQKLETVYTNPTVTVTTSGGERQITMDINDSGVNVAGDSTRDVKRIELHVGDTDNISFETPAGVSCANLDIEGMTDAEIEAAVRAKLAEEGENVESVDITTNADGKKEIKIKVEKEETSGN